MTPNPVPSIPSREAVKRATNLLTGLMDKTPESYDEIGEARDALFSLLAEVERLTGDNAKLYQGFTIAVGDAETLRATIERLERTAFDNGMEVARLIAITAEQAAALAERDRDAENCHGLDTPDRVRFYEHDFYVLSNFSAFHCLVETKPGHAIDFDTSEAAYHWFKFPSNPELQTIIHEAESAHEAFKFAEGHKAERRKDWDEIKLDVMRKVLRAKVDQHEYVRRKLLETGNRELVEDSWRDDYWGWGPNRDGKNMLGKLWMEIRAALASQPSISSGAKE